MDMTEWKLKRLCKKLEKYCTLYGKMRVLDAVNEVIDLKELHYHSMDELFENPQNHHHNHCSKCDSPEETAHFSHEHHMHEDVEIPSVKSVHEVSTKHGANGSVIYEIKDADKHHHHDEHDHHHDHDHNHDHCH
ncbi:hypothetical protein [Ureaplasma ceti]|uniref:Uncharacterized protein n=1 Tax=Ureaplasma ceti TaxID=3119530 RepID=A0ABP9U673_9BACT